MAVKDDVGRAGELYAQRWLGRRGWDILDTNWRCRDGEIDIVARHGADLVFVEVKTRTSTRFGHPVEAIGITKLARMRRLAGAWLAAHPGVTGTIRLDVLGILAPTGRPVEVDHIEALG